MLEFVQEKIKRLSATLKERYAKSARLDQVIWVDLKELRDGE